MYVSLRIVYVNIDLQSFPIFRKDKILVQNKYSFYDQRIKFKSNTTRNTINNQHNTSSDSKPFS